MILGDPSLSKHLHFFQSFFSTCPVVCLIFGSPGGVHFRAVCSRVFFIHAKNTGKPSSRSFYFVVMLLKLMHSEMVLVSIRYSAKCNLRGLLGFD